MRLKSISIQNMRLIGERPMRIDLSPEKNVIIIVGDNGSGKTTVLDAIATALAPYTTQFTGMSDFQLKNWDVHIDNNGQIAPYFSVEAVISENNKDVTSSIYLKGSPNAPHPLNELIKASAIASKGAIISGNTDIVLPIFVYYGSRRGNFEVPTRNRAFKQPHERWDCYKFTIQPDTDFARFFDWFDWAQREEPQERERLNDSSNKPPILEPVRRAISKVVTKYQNPRIESNPYRFVMNTLGKEGGGHEMCLEQMDDGSKMVIAMGGDLASRMAIANPDSTDPLKTPGIVLIDDIELHLNPRWQRKILSQLTQIFENVQFIVTNHSPVIAIGASGFAQIINLNTQPPSNEDLILSSIGSVLLSKLFGLKSLFCPIWDDKIQERNDILAKKVLTQEDEQRLVQLDEELKGLIGLKDSNAIRSQKILEEIALQLNLINRES